MGLLLSPVTGAAAALGWEGPAAGDTPPPTPPETHVSLTPTSNFRGEGPSGDGDPRGPGLQPRGTAGGRGHTWGGRTATFWLDRSFRSRSSSSCWLLTPAALCAPSADGSPLTCRFLDDPIMSLKGRFPL